MQNFVDQLIDVEFLVIDLLSKRGNVMLLSVMLRSGSYRPSG